MTTILNVLASELHYLGSLNVDGGKLDVEGEKRKANASKFFKYCFDNFLPIHCFILTCTPNLSDKKSMLLFVVVLSLCE